jgi:hypothetical protein
MWHQIFFSNLILFIGTVLILDYDNAIVAGNSAFFSAWINLTKVSFVAYLLYLVWLA